MNSIDPAFLCRIGWRMKKPTTEALQKEIAALELKVTAAVASSDRWRQDYHTANFNFAKKQSEIDQVRRELEAQVACERSRRESAETCYDRHRSAVLCYFMAASNPEIAKDAAKMTALQADVCGIIPLRTPEPNPYGGFGR